MQINSTYRRGVSALTEASYWRNERAKRIDCTYGLEPCISLGVSLCLFYSLLYWKIAGFCVKVQFWLCIYICLYWYILASITII